MRTLTVITISILFTCNIFSQPPSNYNVLPQGNPIAELNGLGISGLQNSVYNIGSINPAALSNFKNISFGFSYQFQNIVSPGWIANFRIKRHSDFIPQSAGFIFPLNNFSAGISMTQAYNGGVYDENVPITTPQNPEGNGQFITMDEKNILYKYSLIATYSFKSILDDITISFGGRFNINKFTSGLTSTYDINLFYRGNNWELGTTVKKNFDEQRYLQFGLFYEKDAVLDFKEAEGPQLLVIATADSNFNRPNSYYRIYAIPPAKFPAKLKFDFDISMLTSVKFTGSVSQIYWNDVAVEILNSTEFTANVVYQFSDMVSSSLGFYKTDRNYTDTYKRFFGIKDKLYAYFLTLGTTINFNNFVVDLALADSHLSSGDWRKQTIGKIGIAYKF